MESIAVKLTVHEWGYLAIVSVLCEQKRYFATPAGDVQCAPDNGDR